MASHFASLPLCCSQSCSKGKHKRGSAFWCCQQALQYLSTSLYCTLNMPAFHLTTAIWYVNPQANMAFSLNSWLNQEVACLFEHLLYCLCVLPYALNLHSGFNCRFRGIDINEKDCVLLYLQKLSKVSPYVNHNLFVISFLCQERGCTCQII